MRVNSGRSMCCGVLGKRAALKQMFPRSAVHLMLLLRSEHVPTHLLLVSAAVSLSWVSAVSTTRHGGWHVPSVAMLALLALLCSLPTSQLLVLAVHTVLYFLSCLLRMLQEDFKSCPLQTLPDLNEGTRPLSYHARAYHPPGSSPESHMLV